MPINPPYTTPAPPLPRTLSRRCDATRPRSGAHPLPANTNDGPAPEAVVPCAFAIPPCPPPGAKSIAQARASENMVRPDAYRRAALLYSLAQGCKLVGVSPFAYFEDVLRRLPTHPQRLMTNSRPSAGRPRSLTGPDPNSATSVRHRRSTLKTSSSNAYEKNAKAAGAVRAGRRP
jgi:hypothetical protein